MYYQENFLTDLVCEHLFLKKLDQSIFVRMTGSGSCFYAVFDKKQNAIYANKKFKLQFDNIWSYVSENNFVL